MPTVRRPFASAVALLALLVPSPASSAEPADPGSPITYETRFVSPGPNGEADRTIEQYVIDRINETQPGTQLGFAVRDWTVPEVASAVLSAAARGVDVTGVIDGGERNRPFLQDMVAKLGGRAAFCGAPGFAFSSCISNVLVPGLMHNKFWLFSRLPDGARNVVVQTSQNWMPAQRNQSQDLVRINNDAGLYDAYRTYLTDLKAEQRTDQYYRVTSGDDGRNTMYPMPRRQANIWTDDTIVDRLDEVTCPEAGPAAGPGVVRVAQAFFRRERMVVADKLVALAKKGCDIEVLNSNGDADVVAKLVNGGVHYSPFYLGMIGVQTHTKYWLVDAGSTLTGARTKLVYAGSDNWRADEQQTDDLLLRIRNDGVYDAYASHWEGMKARSAFTRRRSPAQIADTEAPATALPSVPATGRPDSEVAVRITGSDGVGDFGDSSATGVKRLHVEMTGAQTGTWDFPSDETGADAPAYTVTLTRTLTVTAPGTTTVTAYSQDHKGNVGPADSYVVMNGDEGSVLSTGGAFPVGSGDRLAIAKVSGAGTVSDGGDGTWTWSYTPPDDGAGTVVVQASDGRDRRLTGEFHWSAANVAPTISELIVTVPPGPACQGAGNRVGVSFTVADPADEVHDPITGSIDWGDGTFSPISGRSIAAPHLYEPGTYSLSLSVADGDGASDIARTSAGVLYAMTGILRPFDPQGTSTWRRGATIPVKVRILDCDGNAVFGLAPTVATGLRFEDTPIGTMRFSAGQYIYNLASGILDAPATYVAYVREAHSLGVDGAERPTPGESSQEFALK